MPAIISLITSLIPIIKGLVDYVNKLKVVAKQTGEMSQEQEDAFDAELEAIFSSDDWNVDKNK